MACDMRGVIGFLLLILKFCLRPYCLSEIYMKQRIPCVVYYVKYELEMYCKIFILSQRLLLDPFWNITPYRHSLYIIKFLTDVDSIGFWRWCITHRITWFSDFVYRPDSKYLEEKHDVSETGSVSILRWRETPTLLGHLDSANLNQWTWGWKQIQFPKRCVFLPSI
jgi:hypothetical protein